MRQSPENRSWVFKLGFLALFCVVDCGFFGFVGAVSSIVITQCFLDQEYPVRRDQSGIRDAIRSLALCAGLLFGVLFGLLLFLTQWFHDRLKNLESLSRNQDAPRTAGAVSDKAEPGTPADRPRDGGMTDPPAPPAEAR
jgi:hypothetical protein